MNKIWSGVAIVQTCLGASNVVGGSWDSAMNSDDFAPRCDVRRRRDRDDLVVRDTRAQMAPETKGVAEEKQKMRKRFVLPFVSPFTGPDDPRRMIYTFAKE